MELNLKKYMKQRILKNSIIIFIIIFILLYTLIGQNQYKLSELPAAFYIIILILFLIYAYSINLYRKLYNAQKVTIHNDSITVVNLFGIENSYKMSDLSYSIKKILINHRTYEQITIYNGNEKLFSIISLDEGYTDVITLFQNRVIKEHIDCINVNGEKKEEFIEIKEQRMLITKFLKALLILMLIFSLLLLILAYTDESATSAEMKEIFIIFTMICVVALSSTLLTKLKYRVYYNNYKIRIVDKKNETNVKEYEYVQIRKFSESPSVYLHLHVLKIEFDDNTVIKVFSNSENYKDFYEKIRLI